MTSHLHEITEPLLVRPRDAWRMLGCGNTRGYQLLADGELESFLDGRARKITVSSIHALIARRLAAAGVTKAEQPRRGRLVADLRDLVRGNRPLAIKK